MPKPIVLRLGICSCTSRYHGKFQGKSLAVNNRTFIIQEVLIPEGAHRDAIMATRAHFFVDLHWYGSGDWRKAWNNLQRIEITPNDRGKESVHFGGMESARRAQNRWYWEGKRSARAEKILDAIQEILGRMPPEKMGLWLDRMKV